MDDTSYLFELLATAPGLELTGPAADDFLARALDYSNADSISHIRLAHRTGANLVKELRGLLGPGVVVLLDPAADVPDLFKPVISTPDKMRVYLLTALKEHAKSNGWRKIHE